MRATSGKSLFTETLYVAQIIRYLTLYSVNIASLLDILKRFGLSHGFIDMMSGIMLDRCFFVGEGGHRSEVHQMQNGIPQGCALSPLRSLTE